MKTQIDQIEPIDLSFWPPTDTQVKLSIAISLKRIADLLEKKELFQSLAVAGADTMAGGAGLPIADPTIAGDHRQWTIQGLTHTEISDLLGFKPNRKDDPYKVKYSWGFRVDGKPCAVWDYKGSHKFNEFSAWGDEAALRSVFGDSLTK